MAEKEYGQILLPSYLDSLYNDYVGAFYQENPIEFSSTQLLELEKEKLLAAPRQEQLNFLLKENNVIDRTRKK